MIGLVIGVGATLFFITIRSEGHDINSRLSALESANEKNVEDIKSAKSWGSQAVENSIKAHQRINHIESEIGSDEEPR